MFTQTAEKDLNRNLKNFTYNVKREGKDKDYVQYLCTFKDEVSIDDFNNFCEAVKENKELPRTLVDNFRVLEESEVINFSSIISNIKYNDTDTDKVKPVLNTFLNMFDFGNERIKSSSHVSFDLESAMTNRFGNQKKDRRLVEEIESASANSEIVELVGDSFITDNYVGNIKKQVKNNKVNVKK